VLDQTAINIGRLDTNDIQVNSQRVSRKHARIIASNGAWVLEDTESLNGLIYQGDRVDRVVLIPGARVFLAPRVVLLYQSAS
jgi:pSer/pThr/pTyr-binding forkhead associated (FHA) protein